MKTNLKDVDSLIVKYLEEEATPEEKAELDSWIYLSQENERYFVRMVKAWEQSRIYLSGEMNANERFSHFRQLIIKRRTRRITYAASTAAAVVLFMLMIQLFMPSSDASLLTVVTADQKKEVVLPDGSIIWLNRNSTIQYPENFASHREVHLTGEAYFDVTDNKEQPFIVETSHLAIHVLGTRFVVTDYNEGEIAQAVLESGKIQLRAGAADEEFLLHPGQMLTYDRALGEARLESVDATNFTGWINNRLVFENTLLTDVFVQLEKWYGVRIECKDVDILQTPVSFTIDTETKEEILNILQVVAPFTWKLEPKQGERPSTITVLPAQ